MDYFTIFGFFTHRAMPRIRDGFQGQRIIYIPEQVREWIQNNPFSNGITLQSAGFFPHAWHHFVERRKGCPDFILIYCTEGKGWFEVGGSRTEVQEHQFFVLPPDEVHRYGADRNAPWTIYWLHFNGPAARALYQAASSPVTILPGTYSRIEERLQLFEDMFRNLEMGYAYENISYALLCLNHFLGSLLFLNQYQLIRRTGAHQENIIEPAIHFMRENLEKNLTLNDIARFLNYSPSHFSMIFKKRTGYAPIRYFIQLKMQRACQWLDLSDMKINQIAAKHGFEDAHYFSRQFTREVGMSPSEYRNKAKG